MASFADSLGPGAVQRRRRAAVHSAERRHARAAGASGAHAIAATARLSRHRHGAARGGSVAEHATAAEQRACSRRVGTGSAIVQATLVRVNWFCQDVNMV